MDDLVGNFSSTLSQQAEDCQSRCIIGCSKLFLHEFQRISVLADMYTLANKLKRLLLIKIDYESDGSVGMIIG